TFTADWKYAPGDTTLSTNTMSLGNKTGGGACGDPAGVNITYAVTCGSVTMKDPNDGGSPVLNVLTCPFTDANDAGQECTNIAGKPEGASVAFASGTITNSRFYSIKLFTPS